MALPCSKLSAPRCACHHLHTPRACPVEVPRIQICHFQRKSGSVVNPLPWFHQCYCVLLPPLSLLLDAAQVLPTPAQCNDSSDSLLLLVLVFSAPRTWFSRWTQSWFCHRLGSRKSQGQRARVSSRSGRLQELPGYCENPSRRTPKRYSKCQISQHPSPRLLPGCSTRQLNGPQE